MTGSNQVTSLLSESSESGESVSDYSRSVCLCIIPRFESLHTSLAFGKLSSQQYNVTY